MFKFFRPDFTGDGIYFEKLMPLLAQQGVRNEVAVEATRRSPAAEGEVRLFGAWRLAGRNPMLLLWLLFNAWRFDVVHLHSALDRLFLYHVIGRMFGCRIVQSCTLDDGLGQIVRGYRSSYRGLVRRLCGLIDDVVTISPRLYDDSLEVTGADRVHFIPQGVTVPRHASNATREDTRRAMDVAPNDTLLLFVGGLCPRKDVRFLIEQHGAAAAAAARTGARTHLVMVGPALNEAYQASLHRRIEASPAGRHIHFIGFMKDPAPLYRAADVFVFASHSEGCPNVVLEAMAHGLPVIARRLPGTTDSLVVHGRTGLLFDTEAEYVASVARLASDAGAREAMGAAALAAVNTVYDMDVIARRYANLYRKAA